MTQEIWLDAFTRMDSALLDEALCERAKLLPRVKRRIKPLTVKRAGALAACLAVVLAAGLYARTLFTGSREPAPHSEYFSSVSAVEAALGENLPLESLESSMRRDRDIHVTFPTDEDGSHGTRPLQLKARYQATESGGAPDGSDASTYVDLYILFDKDSVSDSYIGGFVEQGLSKEYGNITVVYSLIEDGMKHGQAKFLYEGDLYVLDVNSTGDTHRLMTYLDMLMEGLGS